MAPGEDVLAPVLGVDLVGAILRRDERQLVALNQPEDRVPIPRSAPDDDVEDRESRSFARLRSERDPE
jgi:hypothetical protein